MLDMDNADGYSFESCAYIFIIVKNFDFASKAYGTLSHEITHAVFLSSDYIGLEYSKGSEEYFCYLTGFLTQEIHKKLKL